MAKNIMYLYGKNAATERLKANPSSVKKVLLIEGFDKKELLDLIAENNIEIEKVPKAKFMRMKKADRVQGVIALIDKFQYEPFDRLLKEALNKKKQIVFLDRLNDPQNLGVIIRSLACLGGFSLVIPEHESCDVNETVLHVASGGENYLSISKVGNLSKALIKAKEKGFWAAGTVVEGGQDIAKTEFPFPLCLVMGSEGHGIRHGVRKHLDLQVTLPMQGADLSFNVAIATSIFCYEISKQR